MTKINIVVAAQTNSAIQGLNEVTQATKRTGDGVRRAQKSLKSFGGETNRATMMTRKFAMGGLQQAGYQIGDYAVQVANGTSKMQAFGQQAPQLLQIFGPLGAVIGAGVAIFAAFGVAAEKSGKALVFFEAVAPSFNNFIEKMSLLMEQVKPAFNLIGVGLSSAFRVVGNMVDFASSNIEALGGIVAAFVALKFGAVIYTLSRRFLSLAKMISATRVMMSAFNKTVRRSPVMILAVVLGVAADKLGLISKGMDELKEKFPEFFAALDESGGALAKLVRDSYSALDDAFSTPATIEIDSTGASKAIDKLTSKTKSATELMRDRFKDVASAVGSSMETAMMSVVDGTKSVKNAFKSMASEIIKELYRIFVVKRITGFITDAIGFISGPKTGNTGTLGLPDFSYAGGGYTGNGARAGGLDGKGGFMAMMHPRETVVDHTKGQGMGGVTVIQNNTFQSGVTRSEVSALLPKMVEASKAAVLDAKRQGGSYGKAFA